MSTKPFLKGLPSHLRSFYRLFRRACSASVLHRNAEAVALRNLYRTTFRRAGLIYTYVNDSSSASSHPDLTAKRKAWLELWNQRMDNTLSLLYNSSHTRGLSHQLTKFLGHFIHHERKRHWEGKYRGLTWNPQLPKDSPQYKPRAQKPSQTQKKARDRMLKEFSEQALWPLREVVKMAEGRDEVSFGNLKKYTRVRDRKPPPKLESLMR